MIEDLRRTVQAGRIRLDATLVQMTSLKAKLEESRQNLEDWLTAQGVLQEASKAVQTFIHAQIVSVVTQCLQTVYDDSLEFCIDFDLKRGKTEARLYFKKDGNEVDPIEAGGLGWVEVASFALRMAVLKLHTPPVMPVLILDEAFRFLDTTAKPRMAELVMQLSKQMDVQVILVTHDPEFRVGKIVKIG